MYFISNSSSYYELNGEYYQFDGDQSNSLDTDEDISRADRHLEQLRRKYHAEQMILKCIGPDGIDCSSLLKPVLTDTGICYALMAHPQNETIKSNSYVNVFEKIFSSSSKNLVNEPIRNPNLTSSFEVFIILDSHQSGTLNSSQNIQYIII